MGEKKALLTECSVTHDVSSEPKSKASLQEKVESVSSLKEQLDNIEELDTSIGLTRLHGDEVAYLRLLHLFDSKHGAEIGQFSDFLSQGNMDTVRQLAHSIKGSAGTLGLTQIQNIARQLETNLKIDAKTGLNEENARLIETLRIKHNCLHDRIQNIRHRRKAEPDTKINMREARQILDKIEKLLKRDDVAVNLFFQESEQLLQQAYGSQVLQLGQQIELFNYPEALLELRSLLQL